MTGPRPERPSPPAVTGRQEFQDYPQAIADDFPGWEVRHQDGRWTASCPAITVQAATAVELRAAIEDVISS